MTWWLLALVFWPACSLPLGLLTAKFIAIGNDTMGIGPAYTLATQLATPPGEGWHYWTVEPPPYKRGGAVEVWHEEMQNETDMWKLDDVTTDLDPSGVWWRPA